VFVRHVVTPASEGAIGPHNTRLSLSRGDINVWKGIADDRTGCVGHPVRPARIARINNIRGHGVETGAGVHSPVVANQHRRIPCARLIRADTARDTSTPTADVVAGARTWSAFDRGRPAACRIQSKQEDEGGPEGHVRMSQLFRPSLRRCLPVPLLEPRRHLWWAKAAARHRRWPSLQTHRMLRLHDDFACVRGR
jgi:hypothetical protein